MTEKVGVTNGSCLESQTGRSNKRGHYVLDVDGLILIEDALLGDEGGGGDFEGAIEAAAMVHFIFLPKDMMRSGDHFE